MTDERFKAIYDAVVVHGFYEVSNEGFLESDISHAELVEVFQAAKKAWDNGALNAH